MPDSTQTSAEKAGGETLSAVLEKKNASIPHEIVSRENTEHSRVRFVVGVSAETMNAKVDEVIGELRRDVIIPGFRKGKAPDKLVRVRFGNEARDEAVRKMVPRLSELVAESAKLTPLAQPYFEGWEDAEGGAHIKILLEVKPDIAITDETLKDIKAEVPPNAVTDEMVTAQIEQLRIQNAVYEGSEGATYAEGDQLVVDVDVIMASTGERLGFLSSKGRKIEANDPNPLPEAVLKALEGKAVGETVEVNGINPYGDDYEGMAQNYKVTLASLKKRVLPTLDDEFAKDVSDEFQTLKDLEARVRKNLEEGAAASRREESLMGAYEVLASRVTFDVPPSLAKRIADDEIARTEQRLNQAGTSLRGLGEDFISRYLSRVENDAIRAARNLLLRDAAGEFLKVEVSDETVDAEIAKIAEQQGRKPLAIRAQLEARKQLDAFRDELKSKAVEDALLKHVTVIEKEKAPAEPEGE